MIAEDPLSWFVRDTKSAIVILRALGVIGVLYFFFTLRVLLATDCGIKSSAERPKKNIVGLEGGSVCHLHLVLIRTSLCFWVHSSLNACTYRSSRSPCDSYILWNTMLSVLQGR